MANSGYQTFAANRVTEEVIYMFHKITSLATLPDYVLLVGFQNGEYKEFDLKPYIEKYAPFRLLKEEKGLYERAKIDAGGFGIVWNDDLDVSAEGVYERGRECVAADDVEECRRKIISELVKARNDAGVSQKQLEVLSGVAQPCIARTEKGTTDPKLSTLLKMLEPLGLTLTISEKQPLNE